jgi:hypothetical protein
MSMSNENIIRHHLNDIFKPSNTCYKQIRVGSIFDGAYYLPNNVLYDLENLISFGCGGNVDFEFEIGIINPKCNCILLDMRVSVFLDFFMRPLFHLITLNDKFFNSMQQSLKYFQLRHINKNVQIVKKEINSQYPFEILIENSKLENGSKSLLKIDIEGAEYFLLDSIVKFSNYFRIIIIEFHDLNKEFEIVQQFVKDLLSKNFDLTSTIVNECARPIGTILELTFISKNSYENDLPDEYFHFHGNVKKRGKVVIPEFR